MVALTETEPRSAAVDAVAIAGLAEALHALREAEPIRRHVAEWLERRLHRASVALMLPVDRRASADAPVADTPAARLQALQRAHGEGPSLDLTTLGGDVTLVVDLAREPRWSRWTAAAREAGYAHAVVAPMTARGRRLGAIETLLVDGVEPGPVAAGVGPVAQVTAVALDAIGEREGLWEAIQARRDVGVAIGMLMERFSLRPEPAFEVLRRYSQSTQTKLRTLAREIVESGVLPPISPSDD